MKSLKIENLELHGSDSHQNSFNTKRFFEQTCNAESCSMSFTESFDLSLLEYCIEHFTFVYHSGFNMTLEGLKKKMTMKI